MKLKHLLWLLFILAACSSDLSDSGETALQEIELTTGIGTITSKTRGNGIITNDLDTNLPVSFVRVDCPSGGSYPADYLGVSYLDAQIVKANSNAISFASTQFYLPDGGESKFISWYPQATSTTTTETTKVIWDAATGKVNFPVIDGSTDILVSSTVAGKSSDRITNKVTYEHVLSKIVVSVWAATGDIPVWGTINSIELVGKAQACVLELPTPSTAAGGIATASFSGNADLPLVKNDNSGVVANVTLTETSTEIGYAMVAPYLSGTDALVLKIDTQNGGTKEVTIDYGEASDEMKLEAGSSYNVKLQFKANSITPTATIAAWEDGEELDPVVVD